MKKQSFILLVLIFLAGCDYSKFQPSENDVPLGVKLNLPNEEKMKLSYSSINLLVLTPKCVACHGQSGNVNLENYQNVRKSLQAIRTSVFFDKSMPKDHSLSEYQLKVLWNWLEMGAPEISQNPAGEPQPEPLLATYDSIYKNIFEPKCVTCHSLGHSAKRILLTKDELLNSPLELVLPHNPDESGLVIAVERSDKKRMPPAKAGYSPLNENEKATIRLWIEKGAVD